MFLADVRKEMQVVASHYSGLLMAVKCEGFVRVAFLSVTAVPEDM